MKKIPYLGLYGVIMIKYVIILALALNVLVHALENDIILKPKWQEICNNDNKCASFGGKWVLVGSITFKRKSKEPIFLDEIDFAWHGEKMDNLIASLYRKPYNKDFLAIEENLVCDGIWNEKTQTLIFDFDDQEKLSPTTIFYLVLTVPNSMEPILKSGHFCLKDNCLPRPFKQSLPQEKLILAVNAIPKNSISQ